MSTINEQIVTGRAHRVLIDKVAKLWQRISFWTKASDVEFNDGNTAETKVGAIKGITTDLNTTETGYAADMTALTQLYSDLGGFNPIVDETTGKITGYKTTVGGADTVFPFSEIEKDKLIKALSTSGLNINANSTPEEIYDKLSSAIFIPTGQIWPDSVGNEITLGNATISFVGNFRVGDSSYVYGDHTITYTIGFVLTKYGEVYAIPRQFTTDLGKTPSSFYGGGSVSGIDVLPSTLKQYSAKWAGTFGESLSITSGAGGSMSYSIKFSNGAAIVSASISANYAQTSSYLFSKRYLGKITLK